MLRKKLVAASAKSETDKKTLKLSGKKRALPVEEELEDEETSNIVDDEEADEEADETEEEGEEEEKPTLKKGGAKILAKANKKSPLEKAFKNVPASGEAAVKPGKYEMLMKEIVLQPYVEGKGQKARVKWLICDPDYADTAPTTWYNLIAKDGTASEFGIQIFRQEMAKLGYEVGSDVNEDEIVEMFEEISKERPGVVASLSYREWQGRDMVQITISGKSDSDVVDEYRDSIPF